VELSTHQDEIAGPLLVFGAPPTGDNIVLDLPGVVDLIECLSEWRRKHAPKGLQTSHKIPNFFFIPWVDRHPSCDAEGWQCVIEAIRQWKKSPSTKGVGARLGCYLAYAIYANGTCRIWASDIDESDDYIDLSADECLAWADAAEQVLAAAKPKATPLSNHP
jgi:hypothetical protein